MSSTRPSGIIGTRAPTIRSADSCQVAPGWRNCTQMVSNPAGISSQVTNFRMRSMPARSSELTSVNLAACAVSCAAYASAPTFVARYTPEPETTKAPDMSSSPTDLATGSASPVSIDSSTSR